MKMEKLNFDAITAQLVPRAEEILKHFRVDYSKNGNRLILPCPIHGSDNFNSLNVYLDGEKRKGNFVCWTKHCEQSGDSFLFIIKALLQKNTSKKVTIYSAVDFLEKHFGIDRKVEVKEPEYDFFLEPEKEQEEEQSFQVSRDAVRRDLEIPSMYFIKRGFKAETLNYFDVGSCNKKGYQMYRREVVPVYNLAGTGLVGYVGRSRYEQCPICGYYHNKNIQCPHNTSVAMIFHKWINSSGFRAGNHLYNSWNAKEHISNTDSIVLVEGQGDVWRLHEAGIYCAAGCFGDKITKRQFNILNKLGVQNIYLAFDNDDAGRICTHKSIELLTGYFNVHPVKLIKKDIGEHSIEELKEIFYDYRTCWK
jgi:5S rRNA maturation endonuclease (ribonuclease M5)